ncbi:ABC transporter ATP-binding protein [Lysinibacillus antri]|uniref:ABC transporter ATP-binding protein n=1 Tax=Lysinibacillus antri TaxID=2498145 RepID=A0A432LB14_9BACI|nr:ABC transporter ATP-binding protein [Lysinibacillus antri]RUL51717.1 ABC transporter ATP-binding protein [Lysinibacillus antri]
MIVECQGVHKIYRNNRGIQDVTFQLEKGRIIALAGGNGAGKSTLIRLLTRQEKHQQGKIDWHDQKSIRFMPDDVDFPISLTAEEIITYLASLKKCTKKEQIDVLKQVGLYEVRKQKVASYSKGMRQRLNLAQSLLGEGKLLILDEPTNGLDPYWIAQLKEIMLKERSKGNTILFSTHMLSFAQQLADDVIVMHDGQVLFEGDMNKILADHQCDELEQLWLAKIGIGF